MVNRSMLLEQGAQLASGAFSLALSGAQALWLALLGVLAARAAAWPAASCWRQPLKPPPLGLPR